MLKKALNIVIILQFVVILALGCLVYYLYNVRVIENVNYTDVITDITDNTITKSQAESFTFDSLIQKKENPNFKESFLIDPTSEFTGDGLVTQHVYKIDVDSIIKSIDENLTAIPSFYAPLNSPVLEDDIVINLITTAVKQDNLSKIDIDVSITNKVENIESVIREIISNLNPTDLEITLGLPLKWSDNIDYSYMDSISRFYQSTASIEVLNNLCSSFRIDSFGYTTINSVNAGPITKLDTAQDTIKYYIYKGISSNKINLMVNSTGYLWSNRNYSENYLYNYVLSNQQVTVVNNSEINNYLSDSKFSNLSNLDNGENLGVIEKDGNIKYLVYPRLTQSSTLIELAKSYGLNGYIYKNF